MFALLLAYFGKMKYATNSMADVKQAFADKIVLNFFSLRSPTEKSSGN